LAAIRAAVFAFLSDPEMLGYAESKLLADALAKRLDDD
jgi:hypothetical protein